MNSLAVFITSHGFGHAARACAVMDSLRQLDPSVRLHIFTRVPRWFFSDSLSDGFCYHESWTDVGLVQTTPILEDPAATLEQLDGTLPFAPSQVASLSDQLQRLGCRWVLCDISPFGIAVARAAGLPSVLIENFTWDWIYEAFAAEWPAFAAHAAYLREIFASADYRIQAEPVCLPATGSVFTVGPVSRRPRVSKETVRKSLGIADGASVVLISMGGIQHAYPDLDYLNRLDGLHFIVPGASEQEQHRGNLALLPHHSSFHHPDLVQVSDAVIGKAGYSTVAEAFNAGAGFGFIHRPRFRESEVMARFICERMGGREIDSEAFARGAWTQLLDGLLASATHRQPPENGSLQAARILHRLMSERHCLPVILSGAQRNEGS